MIVINADMHPMGHASRAYPLVRATIANRADSYFARVLVRPWVEKAIRGRDVSMMVRGFNREQPSDRLIATVLQHANGDIGRHMVANMDGSYDYEIITSDRLGLTGWDMALDAFQRR